MNTNAKDNDKIITSYDIAKLAGVSQSTVSRCLNDSPLVKPDTKKRVIEIARQNNFYFNANARSLKTNRTGTIGIVFPDYFIDFNINMYFADLFNSIRTNLNKHGYDLLALSQKSDGNEISSVERVILNKKIDGLIVMRAHQQSSKTLKEICNIPCINIDDGGHSVENWNTIYVDHYQGGFIAGDYLSKKGCKKILCIRGDQDATGIMARTQGFLDALKHNNIEFFDYQMLEGSLIYEAGVEAINRNIDLVKKSDAIFVQNDVMAIGAISGLVKNGLQVPNDIMVVGYDDLKISSWFNPSITTVHIPNDKIGKLSCEMMYKLLDGENENCNSVTIGLSLVERDSTKR